MRLIILSLAAAAGLLANDEFFEAARKGDVAALKAQLEKGVPVDAKWRYDQTALLIAARAGHREAALILIESGANVNAKDSFYGMTPLGSAAEKRDAELVKALLAKGATGADQVLAGAVGRKHADMAKVLLDSGKVSAGAMSNALATAGATGATEIAELLKAAGAKPLEEAKVELAVLERYAGTYKSADGEMKIDMADGRLRVSAFGQTLPLRAVNETTFSPLPYPQMKVMFRLEGNKVSGVDLDGGNFKQSFTRVEAK